jgi:cell division protein FtsB
MIIESLNSTISAYETRDSEMGRGANEIEMEKLRNRIMEVEEQNDKMQSEHDYEIMKLENKIDEIKSSSGKK